MMNVGDIVTNENGERVRITGIQTEPVIETMRLSCGDWIAWPDGGTYMVTYYGTDMKYGIVNLSTGHQYNCYRYLTLHKMASALSKIGVTKVDRKV